MTAPVQGTKCYPDELRTIDASTFDGTYKNLGSPTTRPIRIGKFVNDTNVAATLSWFGGIDHDYYPTTSGTVFDFTSNEVTDAGLFVPVGTQFQVKGVLGTGIFALSLFGS